MNLICKIHDMKYTLFLSCINGFEDNIILELNHLGIKKIIKYDGGIEFDGILEDVYRINKSSRYGMHLYWEIIKFSFNNKKLYDDIYNINWAKYFNTIHSFSVKVKTTDSKLNTQYTALLIKDGIADYFNKKYNKRPNVDKKNPDIPIYAYINNNEIKIYIDTTGAPLYKRGYRSKNIHTAPLNEVLASNIVSKIDLKEQLYDPMCGSGTLLIEAGMKNLNIPSQICRNTFAFMNWFNYDKNLYEKINRKLNKEVKASMLSIYAYDNDEKSIQMISTSINKLGMESNFTIHQRNFFDFIPKPNSTIIFNPPYDVRIGIGKKLDHYYEKIGKALKKKCKDSIIYIFTLNNSDIASIDIPCLETKHIKNANLDCVLNKYYL